MHENDVDSSSDLDRRAFLKSTVATSSIFLLSLTSTTPTNIALAESDEMSSAPSVITPSISEGELVFSEPPPNRAKVEVVASHQGEKKKTVDPRFFIAGGASAAISHGITTPIDVVKTRMQSDSALANISPSDAALKIIEDEGPKALTAGLGPTVIGYGIEGALKFGVYESLKPVFLSIFAGGANSEAYLAAALCAGALASIILCPMEETRIRLVTDPTFGNGLMDGLPKLLKEEGALSPFKRGLAPMLSKQVPYTMGKQVTFDLFAGMLYSVLIGLSFIPQKEIALEVEVGAAFLASIVACLVSHPGDVLLTATYQNSDDTNANGGGFGNTIQKVYDEGGGVSAFLRGLNARFLHVGCIITFQLVIYDQLKQVLGLPASGS
jgi:solute carrier family 25 phosphate transporter 3